MAARSARLQIAQDRVLDELSTLAFSDIRNYVVDDKGIVHLAAGAPPAAMAAVASVKRRITTRGTGKWKRTEQEVEIKLWDKPSTLKLAGQHVGLFSNRMVVTGRDGGALEVAAIRAMSTEDLIASAKRLLAEAEE
jgi:phage terminase small subunit